MDLPIWVTVPAAVFVGTGAVIRHVRPGIRARALRAARRPRDDQRSLRVVTP